MTVLQGADRLDYLEAHRLLPSGRTLVEAVKALIARPEIKPISVAKLVEAFVASTSDRYLKDIRSRLDRFSEAMQMDAHTIMGSEIEEWASQLSGRNRFNSLHLIRTLLKWGQKRGHLLPGPLPTDQIDIAFRDIETPEIFRPSELWKLLAVARPEMVPYLALGAFAGLRTAEIERLDWSDVKFDRGHVEITAGKAKTASRRLVPILPALRAWLETHRKDEGPVVPFANMAKQVVALSAAAGVPWKHNALRHSFVSYRLAVLQDTARVALEAGNSPQIIFSHYRELVTPQEADAWFKILPSRRAVVETSGPVSADTTSK